jgi:hypothetical protein
VPKGVHHVVVKGRLPDETDWDWTFLLQPKTVRIDAPDWNVTGLDPNGVPGSQVLFVREQASSADRAAYDRTNFAAIVVVDRHLEFGLISKVRTVVSRLSASGKAVSLSIPLLEGESVLTAKSNIQDGNISVQLAASQQETSWESELPSANSLQLRAPESNQWVERWHLVTSPIWNVSLQGLQPIYEPSQQDLVPVWHPWPGEEVTVSFSKPVAIQGEVVTVQNVDYETKLGRRLRSCKLTLDLECSVANDFVIQLNPSAEQTSLEIDDQFVPTQLTDAGLIVPAQPGKQTVTVDWKQSEPLTLRTKTGDVILPVEASNVTTAMQVPDNRWVLWAAGPMRGPAVRFWTILAVAILASIALGSLSRSPLKQYEWTLLAIGLTQAPMIAVMFVITWLFLLSWRGDTERHSLGTVSFNLVQLTIVFLTVISLGVLTYVVSQGLLGNPDMFISGNGSSRTLLRWFEPRVNQTLPTASIFSVSVWFYRLLMLFWALWLAVALLRWLTWGWRQFNEGGAWKRRQKPIVEATLVTDPPTDLEPSG